MPAQAVSAKQNLKQNRLLAALPVRQYRLLQPYLQTVQLAAHEILHQRGDAQRHVYFPHNCILSQHVHIEKADQKEIDTIGREGIVGIESFLGVAPNYHKITVEIAGLAQRVRSAVFRRLAVCDSAQLLMHRYSHARMVVTAQILGCYRFHAIEARVACWLALTLDRVKSDTFYITQERIAHILGTRREQVVHAASKLQKLKIIRYSRGHITVLHREGLRRHTCRCYKAINAEYDSFLR
ncbi:MAG: Crp/Fnr family transcriptional regulator [Burkholderiales bacterium]